MTALDVLSNEELLALTKGPSEDENAKAIIGNLGKALNDLNNFRALKGYFGGIGENGEGKYFLDKTALEKRNKFLRIFFTTMHTIHLQCAPLFLIKDNHDPVGDLECIKNFCKNSLLRIVRISKNEKGIEFIEPEKPLSLEDIDPSLLKQPSKIFVVPTDKLLKELSERGWANPYRATPFHRFWRSISQGIAAH